MIALVADALFSMCCFSPSHPPCFQDIIREGDRKQTVLFCRCVVGRGEAIKPLMGLDLSVYFSTCSFHTDCYSIFFPWKDFLNADPNFPGNGVAAFEMLEML